MEQKYVNIQDLQLRSKRWKKEKCNAVMVFLLFRHTKYIVFTKNNVIKTWDVQKYQL